MKLKNVNGGRLEELKNLKLVLAAVFTDLTTNVGPQLLQTGMDLLGKLGEGLVTGIPQLLAQALPVVANLAGGLRENAGFPPGCGAAAQL